MSGARPRPRPSRRPPNRRARGSARSRGPTLISRRWFDRGLGAAAALAGVGLLRALGLGRRRDDAHPAASIGLAWLPPEVARHRRSLLEASLAHGVDPRLVAIVVIVESRGDPAARSPVGARGLMQVMPATARYIARTRGLSLGSMDALFDPEVNLDYGAWFLAHLLEQFHDDDPDLCIERAAGAYNGGPGRMRRHLDRGRRLPPETRRYMATVRALWEERDLETSPALARLWPGRGGDVAA